MARIAPVSMSASAAITPPQALSHNLAHVLRQVRAATLDNAKGFGRSFVKTLLLAIVVFVGAAVLEPLLCGQIQSLGERDLPVSRFALQARLQLRGDPP